MVSARHIDPFAPNGPAMNPQPDMISPCRSGTPPCCSARRWPPPQRRSAPAPAPRPLPRGAARAGRLRQPWSSLPFHWPQCSPARWVRATACALMPSAVPVSFVGWVSRALLAAPPEQRARRAALSALVDGRAELPGLLAPAHCVSEGVERAGLGQVLATQRRNALQWRQRWAEFAGRRPRPSASSRSWACCMALSYSPTACLRAPPLGVGRMLACRRKLRPHCGPA